MAKREGSVAPKERINIKYKPETGDASEEVELPFRFLVMGDFTGRDEEEAIEYRQPVAVDKDNFNDVLAAKDVELNATVPNAMGDNEDDELAVALKFKDIKDFGPEAIANQIPELKQLLRLRDALGTLKGPLGNIPKFRKHLEAILDDPEARQRLLDELEKAGDQ
ncbi:MAG: type VI secretion system contractile sheath small subunit [Deltaproteobacteria bacterium]|nr:type VI secretion system contractile sheath small subunit [Deltaproteobacteria bacterium]